MIPSSKIETRDLSPQVLDGVAQEESVQEVLNKLDNVAQQEDMQKILGAIGNVAQQEDVQGIMNGLEHKSLKFLNVSMRTGTQNPISVTGKGKLYYFCLQATHLKSATSVVSLTIDGKNVMTCTNAYTGGNGTATLYLNNLTMHGSMESTYCYHLYGEVGVAHNYGSYISGNDVFAGGKLTKEANASHSHNYYNVGLVCYTPHCVEFENGFSVSASGCRTDSDSHYYLCYSLDEE